MEWDRQAAAEARLRLTAVAAGEDELALDAEADVAVLAAQAGDDDEARSRVERVLASPDESRWCAVLLVLARVESRRGRHDEARTAVDRAAVHATTAQDDDVALARAEVHLAAGNPRAAAAALAPFRAREKFPSAPVAIALAESALQQRAWPAVFADGREWDVLLTHLGVGDAIADRAAELCEQRIAAAVDQGRTRLAREFREERDRELVDRDGRARLRLAYILRDARKRRRRMAEIIARSSSPPHPVIRWVPRVVPRD